MRGGEFNRAVLGGARFSGAKLLMTDFRGANLEDARELGSEQLSQALTDRTTILPNGAKGPYIKGSGSEKPRIRIVISADEESSLREAISTQTPKPEDQGSTLDPNT